MHRTLLLALVAAPAAALLLVRPGAAPAAVDTSGLGALRPSDELPGSSPALPPVPDPALSARRSALPTPTPPPGSTRAAPTIGCIADLQPFHFRLRVLDQDGQPVSQPRFLAAAGQFSPPGCGASRPTSGDHAWDHADYGYATEAVQDPRAPGTWIVGGSFPYRGVAIAVEAAGFARSIAGYSGPPTRDLVDLGVVRLVAGRSIDVQLHADEGLVLEGGTVRLAVTLDRAESASHVRVQTSHRIEVDAAGSARFDHVALGETRTSWWVAHALNVGEGPRLGPFASTLSIFADAGQWVEGVVVDADGRPVPEAELLVHVESEPTGEPPWILHRISGHSTPTFRSATASDAAGRFRVRGASPGKRFCLTARLPTGVRACSPWLSRTRDVRFEVPRVCTVRGRVVHASGAPLRGGSFELLATSAKRRDLVLENLEVPIEGDGSFAALAPPGSYGWWIDLPDGYHADDGPLVIEHDLDLGEVVLPGGAVHARILPGEGYDVDDVDVSLRIVDASQSVRDTLDLEHDSAWNLEGGVAVFRAVPPGDYRLVLETSKVWGRSAVFHVDQHRVDLGGFTLAPKGELHLRLPDREAWEHDASYVIRGLDDGLLWGFTFYSGDASVDSFELPPGRYAAEMIDDDTGELLAVLSDLEVAETEMHEVAWELP